MIIHIGFPKCASTSIQSGFASSNERFLGCNPKKSIEEFYDKKIGNFFEGTFRIGSDKKFNELSKPIMDFLYAQNCNNSKKVILSYENICFKLTPWDLPTDIKINRLCKIIPLNTKFVICFRNIKSHILSLYKNYLSFGYTENFNNLQRILLLSDYGFLDDLNLLSLKKNILDKSSEFELIFNNVEIENSLEKLFVFLGLKLSNDNIFLNKSFPDIDIDSAISFNRLNSKKSLLGWLECHRIFSYSEKIDEMFFRMSRNRISQANFVRQNKDNTNFSLDSFEWPDEILEMQTINSEFVTSNTDTNINFIN